MCFRMPDSTLSRTSEHFQTNPFRILRGLRCACIEPTSGIALLAIPRLERAGQDDKQRMDESALAQTLAARIPKEARLNPKRELPFLGLGARVVARTQYFKSWNHLLDVDDDQCRVPRSRFI